eukprot:gene5709-6134_t
MSNFPPIAREIPLAEPIPIIPEENIQQTVIRRSARSIDLTSLVHIHSIPAIPIEEFPEAVEVEILSLNLPIAVIDEVLPQVDAGLWFLAPQEPQGNLPQQ